MIHSSSLLLLAAVLSILFNAALGKTEGSSSSSSSSSSSGGGGGSATEAKKSPSPPTTDPDGPSLGSLQRTPHIVFILIDDLGWGDVGFHKHHHHHHHHHQRQRHRDRPRDFFFDGDEVQTPVMDSLATKEGVQLNRHYVHHSCTGTRVALQSGRYPVHVQTTLKNPEDPSSGMPRNLTGLAQQIKKPSSQQQQQLQYATHYVGKWDVGMATPRHTPHGRGFDTSLGYFEHKNDYWTHECLQSVCCNITTANLRQQQQQQNPEEQELRKTATTATATSNNNKIYDLWDTDRPASMDLVGSDYEEFIFERRIHDILDLHHSRHGHHNHNDNMTQQQKPKPLFLQYAPHVAHCPLQVPQEYLDKFDFMDHPVYDDGTSCKAQTNTITDPTNNNQPQPQPHCRKQYHAMVKLLDDIIGRLVTKLKLLQMWDNTLLVITSDNGGPIFPDESASTNYPLRGEFYFAFSC
jgi:arylsulfatase B